MSNKITAIIFLILVVALIIFIFLWRYTANSLKSTKYELENAQATIIALNTDNEKLIEYINKKNDTIKELEKKYTEALDNIPADKCGDTKPSKELLTYFKKAYNQ